MFSAPSRSVNHPIVSSPVQVNIRDAFSHVVPVFSGGAFERGLRRVLRDVALGSLLIQSDPKTGDPLLLHTMIPDAVRDRNKAVNTWVLLLDAQVSSPGSNFCRVNRPVTYIQSSFFHLDDPIRRSRCPFLANCMCGSIRPGSHKFQIVASNLTAYNTMSNAVYL